MELDAELLQKLEDSLDTSNPEGGEVPIKIIGFGEISLVFEIADDPMGAVAYKRLPIFDSIEQVERHIEIYNRYNQLLADLGVNIPDFGAAWVRRQREAEGKKKAKKQDDTTPITLFCAQQMLPTEAVSHKVIHQVPAEEAQRLVRGILRETKKVWDHNLGDPANAIGMDTQVSNWILMDYEESSPHVPEVPFFTYIDTSTPLYRVDGVEQIDGKLFLKSVPGFLRWALEGGVLEGIINRYYDWRLTTIDIIANFYKEQLPSLIPDLVEEANDFFATEAPEHAIQPISLEELNKYYKSDKRIWSVFQTFRRFDRWLKKRKGQSYDFYLPPKIKR